MGFRKPFWGIRSKLGGSDGVSKLAPLLCTSIGNHKRRDGSMDGLAIKQVTSLVGLPCHRVNAAGLSGKIPRGEDGGNQGSVPPPICHARPRTGGVQS